MAGDRSADGDAVAVVPYAVASWPTEGLGNHRAHIVVEDKADAVWAHIPWRRRDTAPDSKNIVVLDAKTGKKVESILPVNVKREFGDLVFQPPTAPGDYYVYYMPYTSVTNSGVCTVTYSPPVLAANPIWMNQHGLASGQVPDQRWTNLPKVQVAAIEAASDFDRLEPMEVIAATDETKRLLAKFADRPYLLFPEDRYHPIRMSEDLPLRWIQQGPGQVFHGEAQRNEFYVFQIGVYAARRTLDDLHVAFSDLRTEKGNTISASALRCFNMGGTDWLGRPMRKTFEVGEGKVRALWFGVDVPPQAVPGTYRGTLTIQPVAQQVPTLETKVTLALTVANQTLNDRGDSELWRLSRLRWLDSDFGINDEVTAPYTPLVVRGSHVSCLGREVQFGEKGFPVSIQSNGNEILGGPIDWVVETPEGTLRWTHVKSEILKSVPGAIIRQAESINPDFAFKCWAEMEFDGHINFQVRLLARRATSVTDIRLEIPLRRAISTYMMGLGHRGGLRRKDWKWKWDINHADNSVWIGDVEAGLQCKLKGPKDSWDMYDLKASGIPATWGNNSQGGCDVIEEKDEVIVRAYSGKRSLNPGEELLFRFALLVTPVKPLNPAHWSQRYYHTYRVPVPPDVAVQAGATIINLHQGSPLNPYINYPFLKIDQMKAYVNEAHEKNLKVKIYFNCGELSNHTVEIWALRSFGDEVLKGGTGGGASWLREHLVSDYDPAWVDTLPSGELDSAVRLTGLSRWHNYYIEALAWLMRNVQIDGLYLDGIQYDREIMKRVRRVLDSNRPGCLLDSHAGDDFAFRDFRASPANKYMEHFPYIDSLWYGEIYNYNNAPDYWLVEISGIPFGLFGEMLQGGGNPWRGMIYGMTNRLGWQGDPTHIWQVWDAFGIQDARMIGYWDLSCPVKTDHKDVLATTYVKKDKTLISLASWAKEPVGCHLQIDWEALGLDPKKSALFAQEVPGFQEAAVFEPSGEIRVQPARGWLLVVKERTGSR
jgi:hypothetical protein